jgi:hypothetical protein
MASYRFVLSAALMVVLAVPALSQVTAQEQDARIQSATQLARIMNPPESYEERHKQFRAALEPMFLAMEQQAGVPPASPDLRERANKQTEELWPSYEKYTRMFAEAYAAQFTAEELTDMMNFYSSPTGSKVVHVMPQIQVDMMKKVMADAMPKLQEQLRKATPQ